MTTATFSQLPAAGPLNGSEIVPVMQAGVTCQTTAQALGNLVSELYYQPTVAPLTGGTFTVPVAYPAAVFAPAGTLATQTFVFPATPVDGQTFEICFLQAVTTATWPGNVLGGPASPAANTGYSWRYLGPSNQWARRY